MPATLLPPPPPPVLDDSLYTCQYSYRVFEKLLVPLKQDYLGEIKWHVPIRKWVVSGLLVVLLTVSLRNRKATAKCLCVTNVTGLLLACYTVVFS